MSGAHALPRIRPDRARLNRRRARLRRLTATVSGLTVALCGLAATSYGATSSSGTSGGVTVSKTVERDYLDNGTTTVADKRKISLTVSVTKGLRSLQQVQVSWNGAHVTGGVAKDINSPAAQLEEYPMALFECRGIDSSTVPVAKRISPETCWTGFANERFNVQYTFNPVWRADLYAAPADRDVIAGPQPKTLTQECTNILLGSRSQRWVPFYGADGTIYYGGPDGCQGLAPQASPLQLSTSSYPSNETFAVTGPDGTGSVPFVMFTGADNAALGCSATVACSLVAVPIEGMSCDPSGSQSQGYYTPSATAAATVKSACEADGVLKPGQVLGSSGTSSTGAVTGTYWWAESNWRNRISVPLNFAPAFSSCGLSSAKPVLQAFGSELMSQASASWAGYFCQKTSFGFTHVQVPETQSRTLLGNGQVSVALVSDPFDEKPGIPIAFAPIAVTGFAVTATVDDVNGHPLKTVRLTPRLLAKLLTMSYPAQQFVKTSYAALGNNPLNITYDPEFQALNPTVGANGNNAAATLLSINTDSDVVKALTSYIEADPDARAWLNGTPDPWGMTVNPNYKGIALPVSSWPLLDSFEPVDEYKIGLNDCLAVDPVPYLPLVAAPVSRLFVIAQDLEFALGQSQTTCQIASPIPGQTDGDKLVAEGRQATGRRFMLGVTALADADRYGLTNAELLSTKASDAAEKFTDSSGRTFVAPTDASLKAALSVARPDDTTGVYDLSSAALRTKADAYPGTMIVYAAAPTQGISRADAGRYATYVRYATTSGQVPGDSQGQLPDGYLPLTAANGANALTAYAARAATAVESQTGHVPSLTKADPLPTPTPTAVPTGSGAGSGTGSGTGSGAGSRTTAPTGTVPAPLPSGGSVTGPKPAPRVVAPSAAPAAISFVKATKVLSPGLAGEFLPGLLLVTVVSSLVAALIVVLRKPRTR